MSEILPTQTEANPALSTQQRASLIWIEEETPHQVSGGFLRDDDLHGHFFPDSPSDTLPEHISVVVCLEDTEKSKLMATVTDQQDGSWSLAFRKDQPILRRYYPRADAALAMAFRALDLGAAGKEMSGNQVRTLKSWWKPASSVVNVSNDGLGFASTVKLPVGARVQVRLRFPDESTEHSVVGDVVRSVPETGPGGEEHSRLAVHLINVSPETRDALDRYMRLWLDEELENLHPTHADTTTA